MNTFRLSAVPKVVDVGPEEAQTELSSASDRPAAEVLGMSQEGAPASPDPLAYASGDSSAQVKAGAAAQMERLLADFMQMYQERNEALKEVTNAHHDALFRLALAADFKDDDTGIHIVRIGFLAEALALALGHDPEWAELLRKAAPMHDVGKIGIPDAVLKKPGRFTPDERAVMNQHARFGADILGQSRIPLFQLAAEVALMHHERFDGRGYPKGLVGDEIAISGRIVAVVDFFDALTMDRCYRPAMADAVVYDMLRAERGNAFDPQIVDIILEQWPRFVALRNRVTERQPSFADLVRGSVDGVDGLNDGAG